MRPEALHLTPDTVGSVGRGHPWVYAEGLARGQARPPAGTPLRLLDPQGRHVAFGLADDGEIAVRVLSRHPIDVGQHIAQATRQAAELRAWVLPPETDAYRLVNGEGDGLPGLVVDRYAGLAVVRIYGSCWEPYVERIAADVAAAAQVETVIRRLGVRRVDGGEGITLLHGPAAPDSLVVREAGLRFVVRPALGQKTGLFLDQRENRRTVARLARDREVVDVFSCTGGFAVHAAAGGARRVTVVDAAPGAIDDARENLRLNGFDLDRHAFVVADAFAWQPDAAVDLLVCDPPNLSHGRDADRAAWKGYRDLAARYGAFVRPGGILASASCTARLSWERWEQALREGLRKAGRFAFLHRAGEPADHPVLVEHPEGRYLKFALLLRRGDAARTG